MAFERALTLLRSQVGETFLMTISGTCLKVVQNRKQLLSGHLLRFYDGIIEKRFEPQRLGKLITFFDEFNKAVHK